MRCMGEYFIEGGGQEAIGIYILLSMACSGFRGGTLNFSGKNSVVANSYEMPELVSTQ